MAASGSVIDIAKSLNSLVVYVSKASQSSAPKNSQSFARLPIELRLKIWKLSLPQDGAVFNFRVYNVGSAALEEIDLKYLPEYNNATEIKHLENVAATSQESRMVTLEVFKHALPGFSGALCRFSEKTPVSITNLDEFFANEDHHSPLQLIYAVTKSLLGIKRLRVSLAFSHCFFMRSENPGRGQIVELMKLKEIVVLDYFEPEEMHGEPDTRKSREEVRRYQDRWKAIENEIKESREGYKVPEITYLSSFAGFKSSRGWFF